MWKKALVLFLLIIIGAASWFGASYYTRHGLKSEMDELRARTDTLEQERARDEAENASQIGQPAPVTTRTDILTYSTALAAYYNEALGLLQESSFCGVLPCESKMWLEDRDVPAAQQKAISVSMRLGTLRGDIERLSTPSEMGDVATGLFFAIDDHLDFLSVVVTYDHISDFYSGGYSRWEDLKTAYDGILTQWLVVLRAYNITAAEIGLSATNWKG